MNRCSEDFSLIRLLLLSVGMLCWWTPVLAHDAFYPHHREDFENMTRRRELRGTVLLSTAVFLCVLGTVVYLWHCERAKILTTQTRVIRKQFRNVWHLLRMAQ